MPRSSLVLLISFLSTTMCALPTISDPKGIPQLFPQSVESIDKTLKRASLSYETHLKHILSLSQENGKENEIVKEWDVMEGDYLYAINLFDSQILCSPSESMRSAASKAKISLEAQRLKYLYAHPEIYDIFTSLPENAFPQQAHFYFEKTKKQLQKHGLHLPATRRETLQNLFREASQLEANLNKNVATDNRSIHVDPKDLQGIPTRLQNSLEMHSNGMLELTTDYPTYFPIVRSCQSEKTRKTLHELFSNRGYPHNQSTLKKLVAVRDKIANATGFSSFAEMDLSTEMAQSPQTAHSFLTKLHEKIAPKAAQEMATLSGLLPQGVSLTQDKKIKEWDLAYISEHARKDLYSISQEAISEYFPLESTIQGLMSVYESFFHISIKEVPIKEMWSEDVRLLEIREQESNFLHGYVLLDLHPRENKYSHACMVPLLPAYTDAQGAHPATTLLICNFAKSTKETPSLLSHSDVTTFFHEFGHGLHHLFARTGYTSATIDAVSADFVEMPSQLLEEWMWDKEILQMISRHYKTGKPLPPEYIDQLIDAGKFTLGLGIQRQCALSFVSLSLFEESKNVDPNTVFNVTHNTFYPHIHLNPNGHKIMNFTHLGGYGARYYGYLWSRVYAADIFETIKKKGLLNPEIGMEYRECILGPGGTQDPNKMIESFLKRKPSQTAFFKRLGLKY